MDFGFCIFLDLELNNVKITACCLQNVVMIPSSRALQGITFLILLHPAIITACSCIVCVAVPAVPTMCVHSCLLLQILETFMPVQC